MFKKYFQDFLQTLLKESKKQQTKHRNIKDTKITIIQKTALNKPETLAISGYNEKHDSSAASLRLTRLFDAVFKKFVNPKLDLMATLEQIKMMEARRREEMLISLGGFLNFENRSRVPALPAISPASNEDKLLPPDELSIGWTGQPTVNKITCNVETSSHSRGFDYAFLNFTGFNEDFEKRHSPPTDQPVVHLRKIRSKSNSRGRKRRKTLPGTTPAPEVSKVNANRINVEIVKDAVLNSGVAQKPKRTIRDGQNLKKQVSETEQVQLKRTAGEDLANNEKSSTSFSLKEISLDNNSSEKKFNSQYKSVQESQQSKDKMAQDTMNNISSSQQTINLKPELLDGNMNFNKGQVITSNIKQNFNNQTNNDQADRATNKESDSAVGGKGKYLRTEYDKGEQNRNFVNSYYGNYPIGIDSYEIDRPVDRGDTSGSEISDKLNSKMVDVSTNESKDIKSSEFNIPKKLIENAPGTAFKKPGYDELERRKTTHLRKEHAIKIGESPTTNKFVNIEKNDFIDQYKDEIDNPSNVDVRTKRVGLSPGREGSSGDKEKTNALHSKLKNTTIPKSVNSNAIKAINSKKDILNENTILEGEKKHIVRNTKSESNLRSEMKTIEVERQFSKDSLRKLKNNKISVQANYMKNIRHKAWYKGPYDKIGEQNKGNEDKEPHSKTNLPKLVKMPENVRDIISKSVTFKAGDYKPRAKHFPRDKFPSAVSLKGTNRKVSKTSDLKHSLDLHVGNDGEIRKKKIGSFLSKQDSSESPPRPKTALTGKGTKRTKVINSSNPSLQNLNRRSVSFEDNHNIGGDKRRNKLPGNTNKLNLNKSKTKLFNKGSSSTRAQNKLNSYKFLSKPKIMYHEKNKPVRQTKHNMTKKIKNFTVDESKVNRKANPASSTLNGNKIRRRHSMRPNPKPIVLKMYGRDKGNFFFDSPASDIRTIKSDGIIKSEKQLKRPTKNRLTSQTTYPKHNSLKETSSTKVKNRRMPVMNLHIRGFSTICNNSCTDQEQRKQFILTIASKSTPLLKNDGPFKDHQNKNSSVTNLRAKLRDGNTAIPIVQKKRYKKNERKLQKSWVTIKNGVYAKQAGANLTTDSAPSEINKKLKRKYRKKSLNRKPKSSHILPFQKDKQVGTSSITDKKSLGNNEINIEVLFKRQCYDSKMKLKGNDSETTVHIDLPNDNKLVNKVQRERHILATQVNNAIPSQMIQNVVDNCVDRTKLSSLKVLVPYAQEIDDRQKPRRWKSKANRLNKLRLYKRENKPVLNVNQQRAKASSIRNISVQSNERLATSTPYKSVNFADKLNKDVERLITNINNYKFPRHSQKYNLKSHFSTSYKEPFLDNLGGYRNNDIPEESKASGKSSNDTINECNAKIAKEGLACNLERNQTLFGAEGKTNLALLHFDEWTKSQLSKSLPDSTATAKQIESSGNHVALKGGLKGLTKCVNPANASSKHKSALDYSMDTIVSKLLSQEKKSKAPKTKSIDKCKEMNTQPCTHKPILQEKKLLESIMKSYKSETCITNKPLHIAKSVNSDLNSPNISRGKTFPKNVESVQNSLKVASTEQLSEINKLVGTKIRRHTTANNSLDKPGKLSNQLERLREAITDNQNKKGFINIESFQASNTIKKSNNTNNKYPLEIVLASPTYNNQIRKVSKSKDGQIKTIQSKVTGQINSLKKSNEKDKIKNYGHINKNSKSSKTVEENLVIVNDQNRNTLHEGLLRAMQMTRNGTPVYGNNLSTEARKSSNIKKHGFNEIKSETLKLTKETLKCSEKSTISTPKLTLLRSKVNKVQPQFSKNEENLNKIIEKPSKLYSGADRDGTNKISPSQTTTFINDKFINISASDKNTKNLKLYSINKPSVHVMSCREVPNKDKFTKTVENTRAVLAPNIYKPIKSHQTNNGDPSNTKESVKCAEKSSTNLTNNKKIVTEKITKPIKSQNTSNTITKISNIDTVKSRTLTQPPVMGCKTSKTMSLAPSFMDSQNLKSLEQQKQENIHTQHPIGQSSSSNELPLKVKPTKANLIIDRKESQVSDKTSQSVKNKNVQFQQKNLTEAVSHKNESKKQINKIIDTGKQADQGTTKATEESRTSYNRNVFKMRGWDVNLGLEPEFI